ncbi:nucleotidyltransferase domain-containing protein [Candidatus Micrarchaeota archaeon]|nr:nucleotidyltransferase domain-containing protein [Candidatus Micrarchaeota archaeon]
MPRVRPFKEIIEGHYATKETFIAVKKRGIELFKEWRDKGWILSAGFLGSLARGDYSPTSDADAYVISKAESSSHVSKKLRDFSDWAASKGAELEVIHYDSKQLKEGKDSISPELVKHIKYVSSEAKVGEPLENLVKRDTNPADSFKFELDRLRRNAKFENIRQLKKQQSEPYFVVLSKLLSQPVNLMRHALTVREIKLGENDNASAVLKKIGETAEKEGRKRLTRQVKGIEAVRIKYSNALEEAIKARESGDRRRLKTAEQNYERALNSIMLTIPRYLAFLDEVQDFAEKN